MAAHEENSTLPLVLIVDDNSTNIDILVNVLRHDCRLGVAKSGEKALKYALQNQPDLVLLDIMMPNMNGYEVCRRLKEEPETQNIAVIFITAVQETASVTKGFAIGAVDYIVKPFNVSEVLARVRTHLSICKMQTELSDQNISLQHRVEKKTSEIRQTLQATIRVMGQMAELRDPYTAGHQQRVSQLAVAIATRMVLAEDQIETIRIASLLHDIGKIRIPIGILSRSGKLAEVERAMFKIHPEVGYQLLKDIPFSGPVAEIVYQHHEKLDGTGYPRKLKGEEILIGAQILAVADVMEAMSSHRPYRAALGNDVAMQAVMESRGTHFMADVANVCENLHEEGFTFSEKKEDGPSLQAPAPS